MCALAQSGRLGGLYTSHDLPGRVNAPPTRRREDYRSPCRAASEQVGDAWNASAATPRNFLGPGQSRVQRFWQGLQLAALARPAVEQQEIAERRVQLWPSRIIDPEEQPHHTAPEQTPDDYFRDKGPAAIGLIAASLFDTALLQFQPKEVQERRRLALSGSRRRRGPGDEEWSSFRKYDAFRDLLTSSPLLKEEKFEPLQALLKASPRSGDGKYDFIRALLKGLAAPQAETEHHKWDLVYEILQRGRAETQSMQDSAGQRERLRKYDMVLNLLHVTLIHADWQLPLSGVAYDVLHFDEWGAREYDPVAWVFESAWRGVQVDYKWDPLVAAFAATAPTLRTKWDPWQALVAAEAPSSQGMIDPVGGILQSSRSIRLPQTARSKFDPVPAMLASEAPTGGRDAVGDIIRGLKDADPRASPDAVDDILKGILRHDVRGIPDAFADIIAGMKRVADFRSAPSLSGLSGGLSPRRTKYFPKILEVSPPTGQAWLDPLADTFDRLQVNSPLGSGKSKYDPLPAALAATAAPLDAKSDPAIGFLHARAPEGRTKYDPLPAVLEPDHAQFHGASGKARVAVPQAAKSQRGVALEPRPSAVRGDAPPKAKYASKPAASSDQKWVPWNLLRSLLAKKDRGTEASAATSARASGSPGGVITTAFTSSRSPSRKTGSNGLKTREGGSVVVPEKPYKSSAEHLADKPLTVALKESWRRQAGGRAPQVRAAKAAVAPPRPPTRQMQSFQQHLDNLHRQSETLRSKFTEVTHQAGQQIAARFSATQLQPSAASQTEELRRQKEGLRRQLQEADKKRKASPPPAALPVEVDLVPDILRLERALTASPIAGYDPSAVLSVRAGASTIQGVITAFRNAAADQTLAGKHKSIYKVMRGAIGSVGPSSAFFQDIESARNGAIAFVESLPNGQQYNPLHDLLKGNTPEVVVSVMCGLAALFRPEIAVIE